MKAFVRVGFVASLFSLSLVSCVGPSAASTGLSSSGSGSSSKAPLYDNGTYMNAILPLTATGTFYQGEVADPSSIVKGKDGRYYLYSTDRKEFASEDLCTWELVSESFIDVPTWGDPANQPNTHLWAPDVLKIGDQWILYYALSAWGSAYGIGYATAEDAGGPWTDQGKLCSTSEIGVGNCIDPSAYVMEDGSVYMTVGSFQGIYIFRLENDGMSCFGGVSRQSEEKILVASSDYEGSYITMHDGSYYLWLSAGSCCEGFASTYRLYSGKSDAITGPYLDSKNQPLTGSATTTANLIVWAGMASDRSVAGPGHNSVFHDDAGEDWLIYHSYAVEDKFATRHLFMDKILYDDNDFPYVEGKKPSYQQELDGPRLLRKMTSAPLDGNR